MDEEMGDAFAGGLLDFQIDLDYEFDASRYFDFSREEPRSEAWAAEVWFEVARSYPPSPLIAKLNFGLDAYAENVNILPKLKDSEDTTCFGPSSSDFTAGPEFGAQDGSYQGWTFQSTATEGVLKIHKKSLKGSFPRGSTLMKPTASQLAKQNRPREKKITNQIAHRVPKPLLPKCELSAKDESENVVQATKRQKLEGGHSWKVAGVGQQTDFMHKVPQKNGPDCYLHVPKLRLTIPREPELETAQRAQRLRAEKSRFDDHKQAQDLRIPVTSLFKARPLNRKILEAPSLPLSQKSTPHLPKFREFNLKTKERATQHSSATSSSSIVKDEIANPVVQNGGTRSKRFEHCAVPSQLQNDDRKWDKREKPKFSARPLDKKILSSKGDIGIFRSAKRELTIPVEFNFSTNKRCLQEPPAELFKQLSLNSEVQQASASHTKLLWPFHGATKRPLEFHSSVLDLTHCKGSKENMIVSARQEHKEQLQTSGKKIGIETGLLSDYRFKKNRSRSVGVQ